jgi:hypothetical protein
MIERVPFTFLLARRVRRAPSLLRDSKTEVIGEGLHGGT